MTIFAMELRIAATFYASRGILFPEGEGNVMCCDGSGSDLSGLAFL
jgi:hypothetical protein